MANTEEETVLSLTYTLVYNFLLSKGHDKAAKSLRKAAKPVVDVKKAATPSEDLLAIVEMSKSVTIEEDAKSDDSSSSSESESEAPTKPAPVPAATIPTQPEASSTSSSEEEDGPAPPPPKPTKKRKRVSEPAPNGHAAPAPSTPRPSANGTTAPAGTPAADAPAPSLSPPATEPPAKKARKEADAEAEPESSPLKPQRKQNVPFSRINADEVAFADERLKDNRFEARGAGGTDYGAKANRDLIVTRGAGFRKEKNKKKRGSYVGGEITMKSHSIKFDD